MSATQATLEAHLKSTLHALSLIISFYSSLQSLSATSYATHGAPQNLTQQLHAEAGKFDAACVELERRILFGIATLKRDALRASGHPLPATTPPAAAPVESTSQDPGEPAKGEDAIMDDSFLNTSLFGDSPPDSRPRTATSQQGDTSGVTVSSGPEPRASGSDVASAIASLPPPSAPVGPGDRVAAAPVAASTDGIGGDDFASLMSMLANATSSTTATTTAGPSGTATLPSTEGAGGFSIPMDMSGFSGSGTTESLTAAAAASASGELDLNAMLSMLNTAMPSSSGADSASINGLAGMDFSVLNGSGATTGVTDNTGGGMDLSGSDWQLDQGSIEELLKTLGGT